MFPRIRLPAQFQTIVKESSLEIDGKSLIECLEKFCKIYPQLESHLFITSELRDSSRVKQLCPQLKIYINNCDLQRYIDEGACTPGTKDISLQSNDVVDIVYPMAGG